MPNPNFTQYGIVNIATQTFFIITIIYIISILTRNQDIKLALFIVFFSAWPWFYLIWVIFGENANFNYYDMYTDRKYLYVIYSIWVITSIANSISSILRLKRREILTTWLILIFLLFIPLNYLGLGGFWYRSHNDEDEYSKFRHINIEDTYYNQFNLIKNLEKNIVPENKNYEGFYFVGFAGDATQNVFMKEIKYVKELFDKRFNTKGRSIALINNVDTMSSLPLASKSNLNLVIQHIGKVMNPEEDILFLYLTSHGSKQKGLYVEFMPLDLNMIDPISLKEILNNSGIKYRILVISACYSGVFTEPLKDENTLIMTASAPDKQSFGCSNEGDFTYLGKALFEEQLSHSFSLLDAFRKAIESINKREKIEGLEPSQPQLFVGEEIGKKLELLSQKLAVIESEQGLEPGRD